VYIKSRTTPSVDFTKSNETNKRSTSSSAKPLREFEHMDWVPIDYGEVFDKRRPFPNQKGMARALEAAYPMGWVSLPVTFRTEENFRTEYLSFEVADFKSS
jgi:hypothetical protein